MYFKLKENGQKQSKKWLLSRNVLGLGAKGSGFGPGQVQLVILDQVGSWLNRGLNSGKAVGCFWFMIQMLVRRLNSHNIHFLLSLVKNKKDEFI